MHTVNKKDTFTGSIAAGSAVEIMRLKVTNQQKSAIHAYTTDSGITLVVQYVLTDPISGAETFVDYITRALTASTLEAVVFDYKVDHMRVVYHTSGSGSGTKTIQVTGTTSA